MGLLEALKQYAADAVGGSLNPEVRNTLSGLLNYGKDRAKYIGGLLDDNAPINQDLQNWHKRTQLGLADMIAGREGEGADYAYQQLMNMAGNAPMGITKFQKAHEIARKNAVEMLGLPENNTAMDRAKAMGAIDAYHGTVDDVVQLDPKMYGSSTGANSAKQAWWAVDKPDTARGYAEYAATSAPIKKLMDDAETYSRIAQKNTGAYAQKWWDKYEAALAKAEELEKQFTDNSLRGQNVMPLKLLPTKQSVMDAGGAEFVDLEGGVNQFIRNAKREGSDLATIQNLADDVGFNGRPATHFAVLNPSVVRSRFAAFDPARRHEADLLGRATPEMLGITTLGGLLGLEAMRRNQE